MHVIIDRMQAEGVVDVFQTVKNLRIQRPTTVQTLVRRASIVCATPWKLLLKYGSMNTIRSIGYSTSLL